MKLITLTQGKYAMVDNKDFTVLSKFKWYAHLQKSTYNTFYAVRMCGRKLLYMHREIMNTPKNMETDHIDGDGLNNCRSNLRICTSRENRCNKRRQKNNTSGFIGVSWHKASNKWRATLTNNGKSLSLGHFTLKKYAYEAYINGCRKYHGEFINKNKLK